MRVRSRVDRVTKTNNFTSHNALLFSQTAVTSGGAVGGQNGLSPLVVNDARGLLCSYLEKDVAVEKNIPSFLCTRHHLCAYCALPTSPARRCIAGVYKVPPIRATGALSAKVRLSVSIN